MVHKALDSAALCAVELAISVAVESNWGQTDVGRQVDSAHLALLVRRCTAMVQVSVE